MGGVDFLDRVISYYKNTVRTRKWAVRVIMHLFDFAIAAGWIQYRKDQQALGTPKKDILDSMKFKDEYADFLIYGHRKAESDSHDDDRTCTLPKPRKKPRIAHPSDVLRTKDVLHLPEIPSPSTKIVVDCLEALSMELVYDLLHAKYFLFTRKQKLI